MTTRATKKAVPPNPGVPGRGPRPAATTTITMRADTSQAVEQIGALSSEVEGLTAKLKATGPKPGWATSEFWIALAPIVVTVLTLFHVEAAPAQVKTVLVAVAGLVAAAYALGRSIVKVAHIKTTRTLPPIRVDSEAGQASLLELAVIAILILVILLAVGALPR